MYEQSAVYTRSERCKDKYDMIPFLGLETSNGETNILNLYCRFPPKEEMLDYRKGE